MSEPELPETVMIMRDQAVKLMAFACMLRDGDLQIRGDDGDDDAAVEMVNDVAQECALQLGGMVAGS